MTEFAWYVLAGSGWLSKEHSDAKKKLKKLKNFKVEVFAKVGVQFIRRVWGILEGKNKF